MKPWKTSDIARFPRRKAGLQWGHGDEAVEDGVTPAGGGGRGLRFNGATAMKPWKTARARHLLDDGKALQWGHGDEAVEDRQCTKEYKTEVIASMGPRR